MDFTTTIKRLLVAGVGAVAIGVEKASDIFDQLVEKGDLTTQQGKELYKEYSEKVKDHADEYAAKIREDLEKAGKFVADVVDEGVAQVKEYAAGKEAAKADPAEEKAEETPAPAPEAEEAPAEGAQGEEERQRADVPRPGALYFLGFRGSGIRNYQSEAKDFLN